MSANADLFQVTKLILAKDDRQFILGYNSLITFDSQQFIKITARRLSAISHQVQVTITPDSLD